MALIGLDPSLARFGLALVEQCDGVFTVLEVAAIVTKPMLPRSTRLLIIRREVARLCYRWGEIAALDCIAVEGGFVGLGAQVSLGIAEARGAALCAIPEDIAAIFLSPKVAKMALCGNGGASKDEVVAAVQALTGCGKIGYDEADAVAVAIAATGYRAPKIKKPRRG